MRPIKGPERVRKPTGSFRTALEMNQTINGIESRANRHPAGLACQERSIRPRMNQANAVVIPQVGHSRPVTVAKAHGRSPSCT